MCARIILWTKRRCTLTQMYLSDYVRLVFRIADELGDRQTILMATCLGGLVVETFHDNVFFHAVLYINRSATVCYLSRGVSGEISIVLHLVFLPHPTPFLLVRVRCCSAKSNVDL